MTVAAVGNAGTTAHSGAGNAGSTGALFRDTNHSPSFFALKRATGGAADIVDFCIPCNPYFPTPAIFEELSGKLRDIITYYPSSADAITAELASLLGLQPQTMAMGNGSTELITWIDHLLVRESLAVPIPTFGRWTDQPMETGKRVDMFLLPEANGFALDQTSYVNFIRQRGSRTAVICNPNNPDGGYLPHQTMVSLLDQLSDLDLVVVDESFLEFCDAEAWPSVVDEAIIRPNVIVLRSLGKAFGLHGVRFGYMVANPALAGKIRSMLPKWNLNSFAECIVFMLKQHRQEYAQSLRMLSCDRREMARQLAALPGMTVYPSQGNFLFVKLPDGVDGAQVRDRMLAEHSVLVRECGNKLGSSSRYMRLVVRPQPDVQQLLTGLSNVLYGSTWYAAQSEPLDQQTAQQQPQAQPPSQQPPAIAPATPPAQEQRALNARQPPQEQPALYMASPTPQEPSKSPQSQVQQAQPLPTLPAPPQAPLASLAPQASLPARVAQPAEQPPAQPVQERQSALYATQAAPEEPAYAQQEPPSQQQRFMPQQPPGLYVPQSPPPAPPQDPSGMYPIPTPQDPSGMYPIPTPQDMSAAYGAQGGGAGGAAAYMQQSVPNPTPMFDQTAALPFPPAAVPEPAQEMTAVISPTDIAEVPPAFLPAQQRGPRPALYWQDQS